MGQQQLLLLVLGIVLVGGAVVAGVHVLEGSKKENNRSMVFREALSIVADLQAWKLKPRMLGGGANVRGFPYVSFETLGYPHALLSNRVYKTESACYVLREVEAGSYAEMTISAPSCAKHDFVARVVVRGAAPGDLDWQHNPEPTFRSLEP